MNLIKFFFHIVNNNFAVSYRWLFRSFAKFFIDIISYILIYNFES